MNHREPTEATALLQPSDLASAPLLRLGQPLVQIEERQFELLCAIADAEERGDWPLAAQLRRRRLTERGEAFRRTPR